MSINFHAKAWTTPDKIAQNLQINKYVFVSGETIWFKNTLVSHSSNEHQNILFVDLCGEGKIIASRILLRNNKHWEGDISIPDSLETGIYLLRAYIGNYNGKAELTSKLVTVINRFGNNKENEERKQFADNKPLNQTESKPQNNGNQIYIKIDNKEISQKEKIKLAIEKRGSDYPSGISLSVYKIDKSTKSLVSEILEPEEEVQYAKGEKTKIYNDLTLNGKIVRREDKSPVENEFVLFSIPDSIPQIIYSKTNNKGEFNFHLEDNYGTKDAIIQTISKNEEFEIILYPGLLDPPARIPFYVPSEVQESESVKLSVQRAILHKVYGSINQKKESKYTSVYPFYGISNEIVIPDNYFDLNDFEEIAKEILPLCKVRRNKDDYSIRIFNPEKIGNYDNPWIVVDGIPIFEVKDILHLNTSKVKKVVTIPDTRCYGDLFIEGAISIFTYSNKFDEVVLPKNSKRIRVETFSMPTKYNANCNSEESAFADFRDVLYWEPVIEIKNNVEYVDIQTSYEKGDYISIAESIDSMGEIHRSIAEFKVE